MSQDYKRIATLWRKEYSGDIEKYDPYNLTSQFEQIASLFAPGDSYFYILNMHNLELDYISPNVLKLTGQSASNATMEDLLKVALPEEIVKIEKKEMLIKDFMTYLESVQRLAYKIIYSYRMKDPAGTIRTILHQANVLSLNDQGIPQHVFSVHSDISHLNVVNTTDVSFIHLKDGKSYCNLCPEENLPFNPKQYHKPNKNVLQNLSEREQEIVKLLSYGFSAKLIAEKLNISTHTVRTHRKNILHKSNCVNTAELVAKAILGGLNL
ncbi:LuxR family transcriptional regulator [Fulvivirga sp. RKSG066]|uniref:response regulator transcription factor n=1 Tax=Fulvivirga aurantia TaxID=2529383 RepID=UPI0012BC829C|nr:helix-turn-helix transcriptional regulator [Fulvivirga aurantia]MTI19730.1 LuxR family transcriptional regulator [Fulvivirga aurantia]